jgi:putative membrane protein
MTVSDGEQTPHEPDYRMSLAAERTFLAYIRTGLALLAAGVGVVVAAPSTDHSTQEVRRVIGVALLVIGGVVLGAARPRWAAVDRAMRQGQPLPEAHIARLLGPLLVLIAAGAIAVVVRA